MKRYAVAYDSRYKISEHVTLTFCIVCYKLIVYFLDISTEDIKREVFSEIMALNVGDTNRNGQDTCSVFLCLLIETNKCFHYFYTLLMIYLHNKI